MAKSKNHTNSNQNRKAHRNGIAKPKPWELMPTRGMPKEARQALRDEERRKHPVSKKKTMSFEERVAAENQDPEIARRRHIKRVGIARMARKGIYLK